MRFRLPLDAKLPLYHGAEQSVRKEHEQSSQPIKRKERETINHPRNSSLGLERSALPWTEATHIVQTDDDDAILILLCPIFMKTFDEMIHGGRVTLRRMMGESASRYKVRGQVEL